MSLKFPGHLALATRTSVARRTVTAAGAAALTLGLGISAPLAAAQSSDSLGAASSASSAGSSASSDALGGLIPTGPVIFNGIVSTVGGCQSGDNDIIQACTDAEVITTDYPAQLLLNPVGSTIVVLGAGLFADGSIRPVLDERLRAALAVHQRFPLAPIIVTGGVPRNGITEAAAMKGWLVGAGVPDALITEEGQSNSTVQNAAFSTAILKERGSTGAVVVTSRDHLKRAMLNFRTANQGAFPVSGVAAS